MASNYDDSSIKSLKGADRVRLRPGVMFGSDGVQGAFHTLKEILGNSLDETRAGFGKSITVTYHIDNSLSVLDDGRGVPMGWNEEEKRFNWDLIFNELYAGGKYDDEGGDYEFSIGLNGLGAAATQYTSEWMDVVSHRKDGVYRKSFKKGIPTPEDLVVEPNTEGRTGTFIHWKIDTEVFPDTQFTSKMFKDLLESQAHLNAIQLIFEDEHTGEHVEYQGQGIESFLRSQLGDKVIDTLSKSAEKTGIERGKNYRVKAEIVLAITDDTVSRSMHYHNTGEMKTGVHASAFDSAVTDFFKDISKQHDVKIIPYDYMGYLSVLSSTYSNITSFANQIKDGVSNLFIQDIVYTTVKDILDEGLAMQKDSIKTLIGNVVTAALARKRAKEIEAKERLINKVSGQRRIKPEKFVDCDEPDPFKRELFIVEGDSAKGACKNARDGWSQALLPLKGKPPNGLKASLEDLLSNQEVQNLINTIGTGISAEGVSTFDISKRQYERIIIATDADVDGYQIRVLVYTLFYRLMPELLAAGMVYVAETPLFELVMSNGESWFAYNASEREVLEKRAKDMRLTIKKLNRSKGLGENDPEMLWETTMNPETRRLIQLSVDPDAQIVKDVSNMLFGVDPNSERKPFVFSLLENVLGKDVELNQLVAAVGSIEEDDLVDFVEAIS